MDNNTVSSPPQNTSSLSEKVPKSGDNSLMNVTQKSASDPAKDKPSPDTFIASKADSSENAKNEIPTDVLQLLSGDDAVFEDAFQELKENEALNVDKYFSDIESSDDSRAYEIKPQSEATPGDKTIEAELTSEIENIEKKVEEVLELEPVDSDEESFVDSPLVKERKAFVTRDCEDESRETGEITSSSYIEEDSVGQDSSSTKGIEKPKGGKEDATAEDVSQCNPESTSDTVEDTVDDDNEVTLSSLQFDEEEYLASALEAVLGSETSSRSPAIKETESKEEIGIKSTEQKSDSDEKKETPIEKAIEQAEEENDSVESDKVKEPVEKSPITSTEANPKDGKEDTPAVIENVAKDSLDEPQEETETEKPVDHGDEAKEESEEGPKPKEEENLHDNEESQAKTEEVEKSESAPENQQSVNPSDEAPEEPLKETMKLDDVPDNREVIEEDEKMETDAPIEQTNEAPQTKEEKPEQEPEPAKEATEFQVDVATPEVIEKPITDTQAQEEQHSGDLKEPTPKEDLATNKDPQEPPSDENSSQVEPEIKLKPPVIEPVAEPSQIEPEKSLKSTNRDIDMEEKEEMKRPPTPEDIEMLELPQTNETAAKQSRMNQQSEDTNDVPSEDEDESLLVIDTTYKEPNETEDVEMDSETEQTLTSAQTSDSGSEESLEVFYDKKCVNYECMHKNKRFFRVTLFVLNFYKIARKKKPQFVCEECFDQAVQAYEGMCKTLKQVQPLYTNPSFKAQELVEIIESSDEEEDESSPDKTEEDENTFPKDCIALLEAELEGTIRKVMQDVNIQNQLSWTKQVLHGRLSVLEEDSRFVGEQLRCLQRKADEMHNTLYQCPKIKIRQLTPLDLNSGRTYNPESEMTIPPLGEIVRESIQLNETYYAVKNKAIASWVPCKVMEEIDAYPSNIKHYKIKFLKSKYPMLKTLSAKHMAFFNPPKVRLPIGTRVIAYFDASSLSRGKEKMLIPSAFYPGIIAEPLKNSNQFRYLVFYDDGYFQYVGHKDVRLVCFSSENVWEDVHHQSRDFIHNYLTQYAVNRPMVQTQKGQSMLVDYNGKWVYARVVDVDCSLVQMLFEGQNRSEWIYRGSTRLGPVYKETNNLSQKTQLTMSRISRRTEPFIRYSNGDETTAANQGQDFQQQPSRPGEVRSVAKKSVSRPDGSTQQQPIPIVRHLNNSTIFVDDDNKPKGKVVYYTARKNLPPRPYEPHICSPTCLYTITHNLQYYSPLAKPLLSGWERQVFRQKSKKFIVYRGPCGKRMRSMEELHRYLRVTENDLNVDNFDFSPETNCLAEYVIESCIVQKKDISNGKEKMPIPCVNYYDNTMPPDCIYSSERIPTDGVPLNLDPNFLVGCDCEDDCSDKARCSCWQLTYAGAKYGMPNVPHEMVGYQYKRLYEHVPTGIYECNSRCKCKSNCVNRVVQQPLQSKLQVFKTSNRGWGLRCINDVPRGSFICVYAGHLLTEQKANEGGLDAGDEYFAELDYIEVAEQIKEGYESDIPEIEEEEFQELYDPEKEDDDDEFVVPNDPQKNKAFSTRLRTRRTNKNSTDAEHDSQERQVINFEPNKTMGQPMTDHSIEKPSIRKLYGKDEACYIMDAKVTGNLGRYFNHSCSPNLFVQNVFVDTHDLRFPWVAFFAFTHIRAGTELTWNYNYEVGVVPGKVLYCQCGAPNCRQRLL